MKVNTLKMKLRVTTRATLMIRGVVSTNMYNVCSVNVNAVCKTAGYTIHR